MNCSCGAGCTLVASFWTDLTRLCTIDMVDLESTISCHLEKAGSIVVSLLLLTQLQPCCQGVSFQEGQELQYLHFISSLHSLALLQILNCFNNSDTSPSANNFGTLIWWLANICDIDVPLFKEPSFGTNVVISLFSSFSDT